MKAKRNKPVKSSKVSTGPKPSRQLPWIAVLLIALLTILFYLPVVNNGFVNWDDTEAIIYNSPLKFLTLSSFHWMFTTFHTGNWIPLTWFSFALDYAFGGLDPRIYHLHNLFLHVINSVLVFFLSLTILKLTTSKLTLRTGSDVWAAALTALLFALHPIHVESVAWATERKDLLCGLFFFASLLVYLHYVSSEERKREYRWACLGLFVLALLSKPMAITLPLVLLLLDIWPLHRFHLHNLSKILWEKAPFFLLSIAVTLVAIVAQLKAGAVSSTSVVPLDFRIMNAFHSLLFYIWKMVFPFDLAAFYPLTHQGIDAFSPANSFAFLLVILISIACFLYRKAKPYLAISWLYYVTTLIPVLGVLQIGSQAAADRYSYIPSFSLLLLFSTSLVFLLSHRRVALASLTTILLAVSGFATMQQIAIWKDSISLWENIAALYPDISCIVHTNLGNAYKQFNRLDEALREYERALAFSQPHACIFDGKGSVLLEMGFVEDAIQNFQQALALDPSYAAAHRNLWFAYDKKGLRELALAEILEAIKVNPMYAEAYNNLGISYGRDSHFEESIQAFKKALSLDPHNSIYLVNLATTYQRTGKLDQAIDLYKNGLALNATEPIYFLNLGHTYLQKGMFIEAVEILQAGVQIAPSHADLFQKLGVAYERLGKRDLATVNYEKAIHLGTHLTHRE